MSFCLKCGFCLTMILGDCLNVVLLIAFWGLLFTMLVYSFAGILLVVVIGFMYLLICSVFADCINVLLWVCVGYWFCWFAVCCWWFWVAFQLFLCWVPIMLVLVVTCCRWSLLFRVFDFGLWLRFMPLTTLAVVWFWWLVCDLICLWCLLVIVYHVYLLCVWVSRVCCLVYGVAAAQAPLVVYFCFD